MGNVLSGEKGEQVLALGRLGWPLRRIEGATGVRRETAGDYLRKAGIVIRQPGSWGEKSLAKAATQLITGSNELSSEEKAKPATLVITGFSAQNSSPASSVEVSASACAMYRERIEADLLRGRNAMGIWQDLVDRHGFAGGYQSVRRFVRVLRGACCQQARVIIETEPGEECQVDYGTGPMVRDPDSGKYRRTRLFVLTLGYSRKSVRLLVFRSSARVWAELHEKAFRRLGGATRIVVLDNLREGVLAADIYDPGLNPLYRDVLAHYGGDGVALQSARSGSERKSGEWRRPCAEDAAEGQAVRESGRSAGLSGSLGRALGRQAHPRPNQTAGSGDVRRREAHLQPLPLEPFRYYQYGKRTVHLDGCVEVEAAYYGAPPGWIGRKVNVQWDAMFVRLLDPRTGELLREHLSGKRGGHRIRDADRPRRTPPHIASAAGTCAQGGSQHRRCLRRHPCSPGRDSECAASRAFCNWSSNMAARPATMPVRRRWNCAFPSIASYAAIWSAVRRLL